MTKEEFIEKLQNLEFDIVYSTNSRGSKYEPRFTIQDNKEIPNYVRIDVNEKNKRVLLID